MSNACIVVPNWNGKEDLPSCLDSLQAQSLAIDTVVVDNGSVDGSPEYIEQNYPEVHLIKNPKNFGFTGGVNPGLQYAIENNYKYAALLNNDAIADKEWISQLVEFMEEHNEAGIATSKICDDAKTHIDSTGEDYSVWGLPYPRGRGEKYSSKYDSDIWVFAGSGGASIYRVEMLKEIGLFDQDFFAYYEDVDISFRAQLAGWKVAYVPTALVYHKIGATSGKIRGFTTYHTIKNLPFLFYKNVPGPLLGTMWPRYAFALTLIWLSAMARGHFWSANKGVVVGLCLLPKKLSQRRQIQKNSKVSAEYINSIITHDLPANAHKLRVLRNKYRRLVGRQPV
jgi:hypothetical protein